MCSLACRACNQHTSLLIGCGLFCFALLPCSLLSKRNSLIMFLLNFSKVFLTERFCSSHCYNKVILLLYNYCDVNLDRTEFIRMSQFNLACCMDTVCINCSQHNTTSYINSHSWSHMQRLVIVTVRRTWVGVSARDDTYWSDGSFIDLQQSLHWSRF